MQNSCVNPPLQYSDAPSTLIWALETLFGVNPVSWVLQFRRQFEALWSTIETRVKTETEIQTTTNSARDVFTSLVRDCFFSSLSCLGAMSLRITVPLWRTVALETITPPKSKMETNNQSGRTRLLAFPVLWLATCSSLQCRVLDPSVSH